jgi:arylsulfatase A-like enzyme
MNQSPDDTTCRLKNESKPQTVSKKCNASGYIAGRAPTPALPTPGAPSPPPTPFVPKPTKPPTPAPRPHFVAVLQDDLGFDDISFHGNDANNDVSGNITALAKSGVILNRHYVHWHCSPTRRSFLTSRLPIHHSEKLSGITDDIDLRWTTIGQKLNSVGYASYWFGKGHTGYKSVHHLPTGLGFLNFTGYLGGAESYYGPSRWEDGLPLTSKEYSCDLYGGKVLDILQQHDPKTPLFLYLPWQNVHEPYQDPPNWTGDTLRGMLWAADQVSQRLSRPNGCDGCKCRNSSIATASTV